MHVDFSVLESCSTVTFSNGLTVFGVANALEIPFISMTDII